MAIPRMFNSSALSVIVTGGSDPSFVGGDNDGSPVCEKEKDSLVQVFAPHLSRVMLHGTAKHVVAGGGYLSEESFSIVAQAEREDFQEFSPTDTQRFSQAEPLTKFRLLSRTTSVMSDTEEERWDAVTNQHLQRNQHRRTRAGRDLEPTGEPPVIRGLWVQEIDWLKSGEREMGSSVEIIPPPPQFTDSPPFCDGCGWRTDVTTSEDSGSSDSEPESICTHESDCDSSCCQEGGAPVPAEDSKSNLTFDLLQVSGFISSSSDVRWDCERAYDSSDGCTGDSRRAQSALGHSDSTHTPLNTRTAPACASAGDGTNDQTRGKVTWTSKVFVSRFFKDFKLNDWKTSKHLNEGFVCHDKLRPSESQYREGEEYWVLHRIQNGSYGDVLCVQDRTTGFTCAAKRIPLSHFRGEEVMTWSALNSARVVELFAAVREGLNVVLFMDLKPACLAQLLKQMKCLPEDLALHFLHQALGALEHLHHKKVLHLDVKVDNVLLSADCRNTFLCDFGLSETLDDNGRSVKAFRGAAFPGTQTHMAPEVARGDNLSAKADVWSSCCMLLHMLNGCHPWIRYYSQPLCLHLVNEPPPLWEVPSNCNNFTAKVFRAGLQKDPDRRASAKELRRRTTKALRAVGGLNPHSIKVACQTLHHERREMSLSAAASAPTMHWVSPWRTMAVDEDASDCKDGDSDQISDVESDSLTRDSQPRSLRDEYSTDEDEWDSDSEVDIYMAEEEEDAHPAWLKSEREYEGDWEEEGADEEEEEEWDSSVSTEYLRALRGLFPLLQKGLQTKEASWGSEPELEYLRDGGVINTTIQTPSPEPRDDPPSCFSCSDASQIDASDGHSSDDLSSGVFSSCNSGADGHLEWLASENQPSSCCFEGVDIWIENVQGQCLRIREHQQVKVGHVAIGISDQISGKPFTLETLDRKSVSFDQEVTESCLWLRCVPAPDRCPRWRWRVRDGKLELRE